MTVAGTQFDPLQVTEAIWSPVFLQFNGDQEDGPFTLLVCNVKR